MPTGAWLAFGAGYGVQGMWVGLIAGLTAAALLLFARWAAHTRGDAWRRFAAAARIAEPPLGTIE
jgi:MATE family multidrug resistance protein